MNCRQFEKSWNELLDHGPEGSSDLERLLESHASVCGRCRAVSSRYQVLRLATSALRSPPIASSGSIERLHALNVPPTTRGGRRSRSTRVFQVATASATALALGALAWWGGIGREPIDPPPTPKAAANPAVAAPRPLGKALAEVREATLELARDASAPASRIGWEMLELGRAAAVDSMDSVPEDSTDFEDDRTPSDLIKSVGERVNAGVRPISGSARHAFRFLLGPAPAEPDRGPGDAKDGL